MAIDPSLFPLEDLVLDRLFANLIESEDTVRLLEGIISTDKPQGTLPLEERSRYDARMAEEMDKVDLLKKLIKLKRQAEMEKI